MLHFFRLPKLAKSTDTRSIHLADIYSDSIVEGIRSCNGNYDCLNTDLDEAFCKDQNESELCDLICPQFSDCRDEQFCNGFEYGVQCQDYLEKNDHNRYVTANFVCDGIKNCDNGNDEKDCVVDEMTTTCLNLRNGVVVPLRNYTRCAARVRSRANWNYPDEIILFCDDYSDQTNCSDPSRVGIECPVRGYNTAVAKQIICLRLHSVNKYQDTFRLETVPINSIPQICDDGIDKACVESSGPCFIHKHLLCDGHSDCGDSSDERLDLCQIMTTKKCTRRYLSQVMDDIVFPLAWVHDGLVDCKNGEDEKVHWPTCGKGSTHRFVSHDETKCDEVFLCYNSDLKFVSFSNLCDRKESCSNEIEICSVSRIQSIPFSIIVRDGKMRLRMEHCLKGIIEISNLTNQYCSKVSFLFPDTEIFGRNKTTEIILPDTRKDCRNFYGEYYVFASCLGRCINATCPLRRSIRWDSCNGQFVRDKIFTPDKKGKLTFLIKDFKTGKLGNDLFLCENSKCITYDKVCNLADDCGDSSDESECTNHFKCHKSGVYLPITQKCDNTIHCSDISDECNETCGQEIVNSSFLKLVGWAIGVLAIILNCISVFNNISSIRATKSEAALLNKSLVFLISMGDFMIGIYLTMISVYNTYHNRTYCSIQLDWLSSNICVSLGIISTTGYCYP